MLSEPLEVHNIILNFNWEDSLPFDSRHLIVLIQIVFERFFVLSKLFYYLWEISKKVAEVSSHSLSSIDHWLVIPNVERIETLRNQICERKHFFHRNMRHHRFVSFWKKFLCDWTSFLIRKLNSFYIRFVCDVFLPQSPNPLPLSYSRQKICLNFKKHIKVY